MKCGLVGIPGPTTELCLKHLTLFQTNDNRKLTLTGGEMGRVERGAVGCGGLKRMGWSEAV